MHEPGDNDRELRTWWAQANAETEEERTARRSGSDSDSDSGDDSGSGERSSGWWAAPLLATVLFVPVMLVTLYMYGLSAMATDPCAPDACHAIGEHLDRMGTVFAFCAPAACALLLMAWCLPRRGTARELARFVTAVGAFAPLAVVWAMMATIPEVGP